MEIVLCFIELNQFLELVVTKLKTAEKMDDETVSMLRRRAFDAAACTHRRVNVRINDFLIPIKTFHDYLN